MTIKVSDVMRHVRNHFIRDALPGPWAQVDGTLTPGEKLAPGMWIAVTAEKLGEYSASRKSVTWQESFAPALRPYLRMYAEVAV